MHENEYSPHPVASDVTAFILTGGKSTRMGQDKATLRLPSGITLLEHALATCGAVASQVGIVGLRNRYGAYAWAGEIVEDIYQDRGPLGGIHAALSISRTERNLVLAVDLPGITSELLRWLIGESARSGKMITVPNVGNQQQPLCAVYRRNFLAVAEQAILAGRNKVNGCFPPEETRVISESELTASGFPPGMFSNVNTPEEFASFGR